MARAKPLKSDIKKLDEKQKEIYDLFISYLEDKGTKCFEQCFFTELPDEEINRPDFKNNLIYNIKCVLAVIAGSINITQINDIYNDCWRAKGHSLTSGVNNNTQYPQIKITYKRKRYMEGQGTRYFGLENGDVSIMTRIYRVTCSIVYDDLGYSNNEKQCVHRCIPQEIRLQECINPFHMIIGSDQHNKDRNGCRYGVAYYCPHNPKCIWIDKNGRWLPCRNSIDMPVLYESCIHDPPCFNINFLPKNDTESAKGEDIINNDMQSLITVKKKKKKENCQDNCEKTCYCC